MPLREDLFNSTNNRREAIENFLEELRTRVELLKAQYHAMQYDDLEAITDFKYNLGLLARDGFAAEMNAVGLRNEVEIRLGLRKPPESYTRPALARPTKPTTTIDDIFNLI